MPTELAEVTRGGIRESLHHGIVAVADSDGKIVASAGDPARVAFFRSSAKPFQAIPLIESGAADRFGFTPAELALCCASHAGSREPGARASALHHLPVGVHVACTVTLRRRACPRLVASVS